MLRLNGPRRPIRAVAISPEGLIAAGGDDRQVLIWQHLSADPAHTLPARDGVTAMAFSASGRLAVGGRAGWLGLWGGEGWADGRVLHFVDSPFVAVAFDRPGGAVLAAQASRSHYAGAPHRLLCFDVVPGSRTTRLEWPGQLESAAYSPSRDLFALAGTHRGVELWEVGRPRNEPFAWLPNRVRALAFSPDGGRLAAASGKGAHVFTLDPPTRLAECKGPRTLVSCVAFSPDGRHVLGGCADSARLWDAVSGKQVAAWDWGLGAVHGVAFAPDGMTAAAGGQRGVAVWDVDE